MNRYTKGIIIYATGFIGGLIALMIEKKDQEVRFFAAQSFVLTLPLVLLIAVFRFMIRLFSAVPVIGWIVSVIMGMILALIALVGFLIWLKCLIHCIRQESYRIPFIGTIAEEHVMHWFY